MRLLKRLLLVLVVLWLGFLGLVYALMGQPPERFAASIARLPGPAFMLFPFETMWFSARGGRLQTGEAV